jgi:hypothetical protein
VLVGSLGTLFGSLLNCGGQTSAVDPVPTTTASSTTSLPILPDATLPVLPDANVRRDATVSSDATASLDAAVVADATVPPDATADASVANTLLFVVCYSTLSGGTLAKTLRFVGEEQLQGNTLGLTLRPLRATATAVSLAETVGTPLVFAPSPLGPTGEFSQSLASVDVDGQANTLSGRDITIETVSNKGIYAAPTNCSNLAGQITRPITSPFTAVCLYRAVPRGAAFAISASQLELSIPSTGTTLRERDFTCE